MPGEINMNKKMIISLISIILLTFGTIQVASIENEDENPLTNDDFDLKLSRSIFATYGPVKTFTKIEITDGMNFQVDKINNLLDGETELLESKTMFVVNMDFKIKYSRPTIPLIKNQYYTFYKELSIGDKSNNSELLICKSHTVEVKGFTGIFKFLPGRIIQFMPPRINNPDRVLFIGFCKNVNLT